MENYTRFEVSIQNKVATVRFNRPDKANALDKVAWIEMQQIFESLHENPEARVIILAGQGKHFCSGIDLSLLMDIQRFNNESCEGRKREKLRDFIIWMQGTVSSIEKCRKPVIAAIQGACVGGGVDIISTCDMRFSTEDAYFAIKEVDMGLVADIGTMQRLPKIIPTGIMNELAYTGRKMGGREAQQIGLVNRTFPDYDQLLQGVQEIAELIASKSPLVIRGTKEILLHTRDHGVDEGLNYMVAWNAGMLMSSDLMESFQAKMEKRPANYQD